MPRQLEFLFNREPARGRHPGDRAHGVEARPHDQAGREEPGLRRSKENPGTGFTAEPASKFRSAKCQSLYFGPPW
jgi:hypothetical protein